MKARFGWSINCFNARPHSAARRSVSGLFWKLAAMIVLGALIVTPVLAATPVVEGKPPAAQPASTNAAPAAAATPVPPPAAPPKLSQAELEKLLMPIALYPDPLIATLLPASVYPLEIVQAARFVADTNNIAKLDAQP